MKQLLVLIFYFFCCTIANSQTDVGPVYPDPTPVNPPVPTPVQSKISINLNIINNSGVTVSLDGDVVFILGNPDVYGNYYGWEGTYNRTDILPFNTGALTLGPGETRVVTISGELGGRSPLNPSLLSTVGCPKNILLYDGGNSEVVLADNMDSGLVFQNGQTYNVVITSAPVPAPTPAPEPQPTPTPTPIDPTPVPTPTPTPTPVDPTPVSPGVIAEIDWTQESEWNGMWYSTDYATVSVEKGTGLIIEATQSENYWMPQVPIISHIPELDEGGQYQVHLEFESPFAGELRLDLYSWDGSGATMAQVFEVAEGDNDLTIDFLGYPTACTDAGIFYQCGHLPGKHLIKNVQVIDLEVSGGEGEGKGEIDPAFIAEIDWTQKSEWDGGWYSTDYATVTVEQGTGLIIDNSSDGTTNYWEPQVPIISHIPELDEGGQYQVHLEFESPCAGELRLDLYSWDGSGATMAQVFEVAEGDNDLTIDFLDYPTPCKDAGILYQCGKLSGKHIIKKVEVIDLDADNKFNAGELYYRIGKDNNVSVESGKVKYSGNVVIPNQVTHNGTTYSVTSIGHYAFEGCSRLTSITIPNSVTSIGQYAFWNCNRLTSITIPNNVTSIGNYAFAYCRGLTSVIIPNSVTSIGYYAFQNCSSLTTVVSEIETPFGIASSVFEGIPSDAELIVPKGRKVRYQATGGWRMFKKITEAEDKDEALFTIDGVTYQGSKSEKNVVVKAVDTKQTSVEIPASVSYDGTTYQVTGIADDAFNGSNMGALIWNVEAALPNNALSNASIGSNFLLYVKSSSYAPSSVKNVVVDGTAQTIVLSDDGGQFYCPQAFTARRISYSHNYSMETGKGSTMGWESIALPFDVQRIIHSTQGEIVPFAAYNNGSNQKPFWLAYMSAGGFKRTADIRANEAYIIAMPNNSSYQDNYILAGDVTFSAENITVPKTPTFNGTFLPAFSIVAKSSSVYALNVNNRYIRYSGSEKPGSIFIRDLRDVRPFEAYLTGNFTRGIIEINFDNGTTDILDVLLSTDDSQEMTIHTLSGQQIIRTTQHDFDSVWPQLPKGVYIVNGKKMIK